MNKIPKFSFKIDEITVQIFDWIQHYKDHPDLTQDSGPDWNNKLYVNCRDEICKIKMLKRISNKDEPRLVLSWLVSFSGYSFDSVLEDLIETYNKYGAAWAAHRFMFGRHHKFNWLNKGRKIHAGVVYIPHVGRLVKVPQHLQKHIGLMRTCRIKTELKPLEGITAKLRIMYLDQDSMPAGLSIEQEIMWLENNIKIVK